MRRVVVVSLVAVALVAAVAAVVLVRGREAPTDDPDPTAFTTGLAADGFLVGSGQAVRIDASEMVDQHAIDSAAGNNAGQPYKVFSVPNRAGTPDDPAARDVRAFRLREDEALVYLGPTPPPGDYFSFTPFLFSRHQGQIEPKGDWMFAALGNPLNNAGIKTDGDSPFGAQTLIVFAADAAVTQRVVDQAVAAGYPTSMINTYPLPSALLNMGDSLQSDTFLILLRTANLAQPAGDDYLADDDYATVLRVTPEQPPVADPLPTVPMRDRAWRSEEELYPGITAALDRLEQAIITQTPHSSAEVLGSDRWWPESRDVLEAREGSDIYHKFVAGEAADTPYRRTANVPLGDEDTVVVYGVNHAATGLATYSNFSIYSGRVLNPCGSRDWPTRFGCGNPVWSGVAGMSSHDFTGTAEQYLPGDPLAKYLYAVEVSRDAASGAGVVIPEPTGPDLPATGIEPGDPVLVGFRAYLNPHTGTGPDYGDVIADRAVVLRP